MENRLARMQLNKERKIVLNRLRYAEQLFVLLDLDGTLVPGGTKATPKLKVKERDILARLVELPKTVVGLVSERPLEQLIKVTNVRGIHYSASLGLEYSAPGEPLMEIAMGDVLDRYEQFSKEIKQLAGKSRGIAVDRLFGHISLDWSKAAGPKKKFSEGIKELEEKYVEVIRPFPGRQAADYIPNTGYNKGTGAVSILRKVGFNLKGDVAIYIGDAAPDEDAFQALSEYGAGFRVGRTKSSSAANHSLKSISEVWSFLTLAAETRAEHLAEAGIQVTRMF